MKLSCSLVIVPEVFTISSDKSERKRNKGEFFFEILFVSSFTTSSARFSKFDGRSVILFQLIIVFVRNIKKNTLAKYFIKVTALPSFTLLRVIRRINIKYQNRKYFTKIQLYLLLF